MVQKTEEAVTKLCLLDGLDCLSECVSDLATSYVGGEP